MICPKCQADMVRKDGVNGPFWGCTAFPACRGSRSIHAPPLDMRGLSGALADTRAKFIGGSIHDSYEEYRPYPVRQPEPEPKPGTDEYYIKHRIGMYRMEDDDCDCERGGYQE